MVISGSLTTPHATYCFHFERYRNASHAVGIVFHERFDIGNGWVNIDLFKVGFKLVLTTISAERERELEAKEADDVPENTG